MTDLVDDLETVVESACSALETVLDQDWSVLAAGLVWTCWGTVEHTADDLFAYAAQISGRRPALDAYVPFACHATAADEPECAVHAEVASGNVGLVQVLDASGGLLVAVDRQADPAKRGGHPYGVSDPHGFAAMGTVEVLLHLPTWRSPSGSRGARTRTSYAACWTGCSRRSRPTASRGRRCCGSRGATRPSRWTRGGGTAGSASPGPLAARPGADQEKSGPWVRVRFSS